MSLSKRQVEKLFEGFSELYGNKNKSKYKYKSDVDGNNVSVTSMGGIEHLLLMGGGAMKMSDKAKNALKKYYEKQRKIKDAN